MHVQVEQRWHEHCNRGGFTFGDTYTLSEARIVQYMQRNLVSVVEIALKVDRNGGIAAQARLGSRKWWYETTKEPA